MTIYDVFLSFGGPDRNRARDLAKTLRKSGFRVFMDESIHVGEGINQKLEEALWSSKIMVAYYSAGYPARSACQFELTAAFLAGQREGDPQRRILVVNPEPGTDHLSPIQLADTKFATPDDNAALVAAVAGRVSELDTPLSGAPFAGRPQWFGKNPPGWNAFVGRFSEQWELHSALTRSDLPLISGVTSGPTVALSGIAGMGKSSLVAAYAWQFGAAHPGGVFWTSLTGADETDVLARWSDELREVTTSLFPDTVVSGDRRDLEARIGHHLATGVKPALWVVDDVPGGLSREVLGQLVIPGAPALRTVLVSRVRPADPPCEVVLLDRMSGEDARLLLRGIREPDELSGDTETPDDVALDRLADQLDGHALSLRLAGLRLANQQGLLSYADYTRLITSDRSSLDPAVHRVREAFGDLDATEERVVRVAAACAAAPLPAELLAELVGSVYPDVDRGAVGPALQSLRERALAERLDHSWRFHAIVLQAARDHFTEPPGLRDIVADRLLAAPTISIASLVPHLAILADSGTDRTERLLRVLVAHYRAQGESRAAARYAERLLAGPSPTASDLLAAAELHQQAGNHDDALRRAIAAMHDGAPEATVVAAQALDALGRLREADAYWASLPDDDPAAPMTARRAMLELARLRAQRLRGEMRPARHRVEALLTRLAELTGVEADDLRQAARLELALIQLSTNDQERARTTAASVVEHYAGRSLPDHDSARAAHLLEAQAWLTLHLFELDPDPTKWADAARDLNDRRSGLRRTHGPRSTHTLATDVEFGFALLCLGRGEEAADHLTKTLATLRSRFDPDHPLVLRATLFLGRSAAQRHRYQEARDLHRRAYDGLRTVLGPKHPDTLHAQYGLGVALMLTNGRPEGRRLLAEVRATAPQSVGRKSDLYWQSWAAGVLQVLPGTVWRFVAR